MTNKRALEVFREDEFEKCCGKCRFSRRTPDMEMQCMRHKIQTNHACLCSDWQECQNLSAVPGTSGRSAKTCQRY